MPTTAHDDEDNDEIEDRLRAVQPPATSSSTPSSSSSTHQQHMTGTDTDVLETASEGRSSAWATRLGHSKGGSVATTASTMTIPQQQRDESQRSEGEVVEELEDHEHDTSNGYGQGYDGSIDSAPPSLSFSSYDTSDQSSSRLAYEGQAADRYGASAVAGASWGAKFWVVIEDPKVSRRERVMSNRAAAHLVPFLFLTHADLQPLLLQSIDEGVQMDRLSRHVRSSSRPRRRLARVLGQQRRPALLLAYSDEEDAMGVPRGRQAGAALDSDPAERLECNYDDLVFFVRHACFYGSCYG